MYTVYVLKNPKGVLYKGCTDNLSRRFVEHNSGHTVSTRNRGPWDIVYKEEFTDRKEALARERFFKSGKGREMLKRIVDK